MADPDTPPDLPPSPSQDGAARPDAVPPADVEAEAEEGEDGEGV